MTIESIVAQLAFYYRESLYIDAEKRVPNVVVTEAIRWFKERFKTDEAAQKFAVKIKYHFHPTSTVPFPLIADLQDIDNIYEPPQPVTWGEEQRRLYFDTNARYGDTLQSSTAAELTMGEALGAFAENNNVPLNPTAEGRGKPSLEIYAEAEISFTHALRQYGIMRVYQAYCECHHDEL